MKECDNSKIHISSNFLLSIRLLKMLDTFITRTITTLQHFATLHHTSPNYTSLHLSTLHFLSFTLHYTLIWLNPFTFPTVLFHLIRKNFGKHEFHDYFENCVFTRDYGPQKNLKNHKNLHTFIFSTL